MDGSLLYRFRSKGVDISPESESLRYVASRVGYRSLDRYRARADFLFKGISLQGSRVLEIGCGAGAWSLWAAVRGASSVLGLEPEAEGSGRGTAQIFADTVKTLNLQDRVSISSLYLQELKTKERFDIVVLYDVINHLDESAVVSLHCDPRSQKRFHEIAQQLFSLTAPGGFLLIADCARSNFWKSLSLESPLARSIEWEKHQNPSVWIQLFKNIGYQTVDLRWSPLYPFGALSSNWLMQYMTSSHFVLRLRKPLES